MSGQIDLEMGDDGFGTVETENSATKVQNQVIVKICESGCRSRISEYIVKDNE